jgi:hypothetical protein
MSGAVVNNPSAAQGPIHGIAHRGRWEDLSSSATIYAGETFQLDGDLFQAIVDHVKGSDWDVTRQNENRRLSARYHPQHMALLGKAAMISPTTGGRNSRQARFNRPQGTGIPRTLTLVSGTSNSSDYYYSWAEDVTVVFPTDGAVVGDLQIFGARSVTAIGGRLTADKGDGTFKEGGSFMCRAIKDFVWAEGLMLDLAGRPSYHDAFNMHGRTGGRDSILGWSFPDCYIISCRVHGVQGARTGTHGDVFQAQGPIGGFYCDLLTAASQYQGFIFQNVFGQGGPFIVSRANFLPYSPVDDGSGDTSAFLFWYTPPAAAKDCPPLYVDEVYCQTSGGRTLGGSLVWPKIGWGSIEGVSQAEGQEVGWTDPEHYWVADGQDLYASEVTNVFTTQTRNGANSPDGPHGLSNGDEIVFYNLDWKDSGSVNVAGWSGGVVSLTTVSPTHNVQVGEVVHLASASSGSPIPDSWIGDYLVTAVPAANQMTLVKQTNKDGTPANPATNPGTLTHTANWSVPTTTLVEQTQVYFARDVTPNTLKVATTLGGAAIDLVRELTSAEVNRRREFVTTPPNMPVFGVVKEWLAGHDIDYVLDDGVQCGLGYVSKGPQNPKADLVNGIIPVGQLASGTRNGRRFLHDDGTWQDLGSGTPDGTKFLRDDLTWAAATFSIPKASASTLGAVKMPGGINDPTAPLALSADDELIRVLTSDTALTSVTLANLPGLTVPIASATERWLIQYWLVLNSLAQTDATHPGLKIGWSGPAQLKGGTWGGPTAVGAWSGATGSGIQPVETESTTPTFASRVGDMIFGGAYVAKGTGAGTLQFRAAQRNTDANPITALGSWSFLWARRIAT